MTPPVKLLRPPSLPEAQLQKYEKWLIRIRSGALLAVCFFAPWWWRPGWSLPGLPYFFGFLLIVPLAVACLSCVLTGLGGVTAWKPIRLWLIPWLALIGWTFLSQDWALYPGPASDATWQLLAILLFAVLMATAAPAPRTVALALAAGALFQAVIALAQAAHQGPIGLGAFGEFAMEPGVSVLRAEGLLWIRPYGLTVHPNVLGGDLAVGLLAIAGLLWSNARNWPRWLMITVIGSGGLIFWALLLSFSRSAWIGAGGGLIVLAILSWIRARPRLNRPVLGRTLLALTALSIVFIVIYRPFVFSRTGFGDETFEQRSISDREMFIGYTLRMIQAHPLFGLGVGMNAWQSAQFIQDDPRQIDLQAQSVHNIPLLIWSELGLVGLGLWLAALIGAAWIILRPPNPDPVVFSLAAGALALLAVGLVDYYPWGLLQGGLPLFATLGAALRASVQLSLLPGALLPGHPGPHSTAPPGS